MQNSSLRSSQQLTHYRPKPAEDVREQQVLEQVKSLQETLNEDMSQLKKELKETKVCGVMCSAANYSRSSDICPEIIGMRRVSNTCGRTKCPTDGRRVKKSQRQLSVANVQIWQTTNDKGYKILKFKNDKSNLIQVRSCCDVCSYYSDYLRKWETFSDTWIEGSANFKIRHSQDQQDEQHKRVI